MPDQLTPEQIQEQRRQQIQGQRHQQQLDANYQRSMERMATPDISLYDDQLSEVDTTPFFLRSAPYLDAAPEPAAPLEVRQESRSEKKKRASMEKQYRKARESARLADRKEGSGKTRAFRLTRRISDTLGEGEYKREQSVLDRRLTAIEEQEKADLLAVDLMVLQQKNASPGDEVAPENSAEAKRLEARWNAQKARAEAYHVMAAQMPLGSKEREKLMEKTEEEVLKAGRLKREYSVACMPEGAEKTREAATIKRHAKFDFLKKIFRTPSPYSHEDAAVTLANGKTLVNAGRATLGGTKAMYVFEDQSELVDGTPQEWLFKEATNCVGMSKPEGAVVTGEASKLQQHLRGALSIPAQCLKDGQGKVVGSVQKRMQKAEGGVDLFAWQAQEDLTVNEPSAVTKADLMHEHTLDWILCNFDTKGENFINQDGGHIISFDKEASFNTLLQEESREMSYTFKPHSNDTIYNTMFRAYAEGKIQLDLDANLESIQKMEQLGENNFIDMFHETLDTKYGTGTEDRAEAERILRTRHRDLRETYRRFYTQLIRERIDSLHSNTEENREERERLDGLLAEGTFVFADERQNDQADA